MSLSSWGISESTVYLCAMESKLILSAYFLTPIARIILLIYTVFYPFLVILISFSSYRCIRVCVAMICSMWAHSKVCISVRLFLSNFSSGFMAGVLAHGFVSFLRPLRTTRRKFLKLYIFSLWALGGGSRSKIEWRISQVDSLLKLKHFEKHTT